MNQNIRLIRRIAGAMLVIGLVGFLGAILAGAGLAKYIPPGMQLPLSELEGPALDRSGNIYCLSRAYSRLHVYDSNGRFVRSWTVGLWGHAGTVHLDDRDRVHVYVSLHPAHYIYDTQGRLLSEEKLSGYDTRADGSSGPNTGPGYQYVVRHPTIWPQVVKVGADGRESVVVRPNLLLWIFAGPLPAGFFVALAIIILGSTQRYVREDSPHGDR